MLYECSCSFTAESATAFYKHLAKSKEGDDDTTHQLVQAKFTEGGRARGPRHRSESPIALTHSEIQPSALKPGENAGPTSDLTPPMSYAINQPGENAGPTSDLTPPMYFAICSLEEEEVNTVAAPLVSKALAAGERFNIRTALDRFQAEDNGQEAKRRSELLVWGLLMRRVVVCDASHGHDDGNGDSDLGDMPIEASLGNIESLSAARASGLRAADADSSPASSLPPLPISRNADISSDALGRASSGYSLPPAASAALQAGSSLFGMMVQGMNPLKLFGLVAFENKTSGEVQRTRLRYSAPSSIPTDQSWGVVVPVVEDVLMWKEPWQSAKVFGMGLYVLLCYSQLSRGMLYIGFTGLWYGALCVALLQPTLPRYVLLRIRRSLVWGSVCCSATANSPEVFGMGLFVLLCYSQLSRGSELLQPSTALLFATFVMLIVNIEQDVYDRTTVALNAVASVVIPYTAATVSICYRALSGRRLVTSVLVAVVLWSGMVLGELRVTSQVVFCALSYIGFFTLPACYVNGSHSTAILGGITFLAIVIWAPLNIATAPNTQASGHRVGIVMYATALRGLVAGSGPYSSQGSTGYRPSPRPVATEVES
eukprot:gene22233-29300_t